MGHLWPRLRLPAALALILLGALAFPAPSAVVGSPLAQEQDDDTDDDSGTATPEYDAGIYTGSCDTLGVDPAFPLTPLSPHGDAEVYVSETEIGAPIADLLAEQHAITIVAAGEDLASTRACADLSGQAVDGEVIAPLRAPDDGDLLGVAVLEEREGATVVDIFLVLASGDAAVDDGADDDDDDDNGADDGGV